VQFDGMDESSIHSAMTEVLSSQALEAEGAERGSEAGIYQLAYAAQNVT
jgi:hypothetical protein